VVDLNIPMNDSPKWFEGAKLNFTENVLKYRDDRLALIVDVSVAVRRLAESKDKVLVAQQLR
ncbi:hypothetical protein TNCV_2739001, partial [Trichonephila clavipes]